MATEAPRHRELLGLIDLPHLVDAPVAAHAADALGDVDRVIEEDVTRQRRHAFPLNRPPGEPARADLLELRARRPHLAVTAHAHRRRGDAGVGRPLDAGVAVATVDAVVADVMAVIELHRLRARIVLTGLVRRSHDRHAERGEPHDAERDRAERPSIDGVAPRREERRHDPRNVGTSRSITMAEPPLFSWPCAAPEASRSARAVEARDQKHVQPSRPPSLQVHSLEMSHVPVVMLMTYVATLHPNG